MPINLNYQYHRVEPEPEPEPPERILSPFTRKFLHWAILFTAMFIAYMVIFSKVIALQTEESFVTSAYNTARVWTNKTVGLDIVSTSTVSEAPAANPANYDPILTARLSGYILIAIEQRGEAWYVNPDTLRRYYLGAPDDLSRIMRRFGVGATHDFITGQKTFPDSYLGKILIDTTSQGETYYINPRDKKAYFLGTPDEALAVVKRLGMGITNINLEKIEIGIIE